MIYIENKKRKIERIESEYPNAIILDITSASEAKYAQWLSPFFPHGNIPIPFSEGLTATSVEGVWQGLKVFRNYDVDCSSFRNDTMKNIKRTVRKYGPPLGHRKGVNGNELLNYFDARMQIYLPTYKWVLDNIHKVHNVVEKIREQSKYQDIVLLDYNTNINYRDISKPLSHAGLVKLYIENKYPQWCIGEKPLTTEETDQIRKKEKEEKKTRKLQVFTSTASGVNKGPTLFDDM